jgi:hypothetical protein
MAIAANENVNINSSLRVYLLTVAVLLALLEAVAFACSSVYAQVCIWKSFEDGGFGVSFVGQVAQMTLSERAYFYIALADIPYFLTIFACKKKSTALVALLALLLPTLLVAHGIYTAVTLGCNYSEDVDIRIAGSMFHGLLILPFGVAQLIGTYRRFFVGRGEKNAPPSN